MAEPGSSRPAASCSALSTPDDVNPTVDLDDEDVYEDEDDKVEAPRTKKRVRDKPPVTKRNTGS